MEVLKGVHVHTNPPAHSHISTSAPFLTSTPLHLRTSSLPHLHACTHFDTPHLHNSSFSHLHTCTPVCNSTPPRMHSPPHLHKCTPHSLHTSTPAHPYHFDTSTPAHILTFKFPHLHTLLTFTPPHLRTVSFSHIHACTQFQISRPAHLTSIPPHLRR